jgi:hypothetical protein
MKNQNESSNINQRNETRIIVITITPKDALKAKTMQAGWQVCEVENHYTKPAQGDGSTVHYYEITVVDGPYAGVPLNELTISEKAIGMGKNFFIACGMPNDLWLKAEKEAVQFDEKLPVGKKIRVMVKPVEFGGRMLNKASDFMPLETAGFVKA